MKINNIDFGSYNPIRKFDTGQRLGATEILGGGVVEWAMGRVETRMTVRHWVGGSALAIAGNGAGSQGATEALCRWLEEMAGNEASNPVKVRWNTNRALPQDGWWFISKAVPDYSYTASGWIPVDIEMVLRGPASAPLAIWYMPATGGGLPTTATGLPINLIAAPCNSQGGSLVQMRSGADGGIPFALNPPMDPLPYMPSQNSDDQFLGAVRAWDMMAAVGQNPPGVGSVNANWLEVRGNDHTFTGDLCFANGLMMVTNSVSQQATLLWFWDSVLLKWTQNCQAIVRDPQGNIATPIQASVERIGPEEALVEITYATVTGNVVVVTYYLQRGHRFVRLRVRPRTFSNSKSWIVEVQPSVQGNPNVNFGVAKQIVIFTSNGIGDAAAPGDNPWLPATSDYLYAAYFVPSAALPSLTALHYVTPPTYQPEWNNPGGTINLGDNAGPAQNVISQYAISITPLGAHSSSPPTATTYSLQGQASRGTLTGGFVSVADTAAVGGNAAKLPNTTVAGAKDDAVTGCTNGGIPLPAGKYMYWARLRVSSTASGTAQLKPSIWNFDAATDALGSVILAPNSSGTFGGRAWAVGTTYSWIPIGMVTANGSDRYDAYLFTTATATVDWFIDELVIAPLQIGLGTFGPKATIVTPASFVGSEGPQDIWQQSMYARITRSPEL